MTVTGTRPGSRSRGFLISRGAWGSRGARVIGTAVAVIGTVTLMSIGPVDLVIAAPIALIVCAAAVWIGVRHPLVALSFFLIALFFRLALPKVLPLDAFLPAFGGLLLSMGVWAWNHRERIPRPGAIEVFMVAYLLWNVISVLSPHEYAATSFLPDVTPINLFRMILSAAFMPFTLYVIGRSLRDRSSRAEVVLWMMVAFAAYSALVSIAQFHAPALVWPRYIVESPNWVGRANGVPNQPVVNGIVLVVGFAIAMYLASRRSEPPWRRTVAVVVVLASAYAVFLTHTRIIYLAFVLILLIGIVAARGYRTGFALTAALGAAMVIANWSTFTSSDREKGGVGSTSEVLDRLNTAATSLRAFEEHPLAGWGLGRFISVNTLDHEQWAPDIPFERGLGIASHFNELGILAELGLIGLVLWVTLLVLLAVRLYRAYRTVPATVDDPKEQADNEFAHALVVIAIMALVVMVTAGTSVDLRLFDFPVVAVMLLVGMGVGPGAMPARPRRPSPFDGIPAPRRASDATGPDQPTADQPGPEQPGPENLVTDPRVESVPS